MTTCDSPARVTPPDRHKKMVEVIEEGGKGEGCAKTPEKYLEKTG